MKHYLNLLTNEETVGYLIEYNDSNIKSICLCSYVQARFYCVLISPTFFTLTYEILRKLITKCNLNSKIVIFNS